MSKIVVTLVSRDIEGHENGINQAESDCVDGATCELGLGYLPGLGSAALSDVSIWWRGDTFSPSALSVVTDWEAEKQLLTFEK